MSREATPGKLNIASWSLSDHNLHFSNELAQRQASLPDAADKKASVEKRSCQLRDIVHSTVLAVLGHALRQNQNWFDDSDTAISNLLIKMKRLRKAYVTPSTGANKAAFQRSRRLV
ncbi:hypothetical protein SprV_0602234800 [Sparganum proliferum]